MSTDAVVQISAGSGTNIDVAQVTRSDGTIVERQRMEPQGSTAEGATLTDNPVPVAGVDGVGILRALFTAYDGSLLVRHRDEIFSEMLLELRRIRHGLSLLINLDLDELELHD